MVGSLKFCCTIFIHGYDFYTLEVSSIKWETCACYVHVHGKSERNKLFINCLIQGKAREQSGRFSSGFF